MSGSLNSIVHQSSSSNTQPNDPHNGHPFRAIANQHPGKMHSTLVRAQNIFGFFTTVAFVLAGLIAVSVVTFPQRPSARLDVRTVQVVRGRPHQYAERREEYAHIRFDLEAGAYLDLSPLLTAFHSPFHLLTLHSPPDLSTLINWNTKQLFVYVLARWPSSSSSPTGPNTPDNEAIIWDTIIASPQTPPSLPAFLGFLNKPTPSKPTRKNKRASAATSKTPATAKPGVLSLTSAKPKYGVTSATGSLALASNATLELGWNVQPWVGALTWTNRVRFGRWQPLVDGVSKTWAFPDVKGKKAEGEAAAKAKRAAGQAEGASRAS
ncbi:MAG: hypothetical protein M1817_000577 [Caeruleum heppii]|nr:MAG: hypothetical protein M1817_000577 [Caeruleum heppii]